jgi:hypothetical protein
MRNRSRPLALALLALVVLGCVGSGCTRDTAPALPSGAGRTYVTRESLEPDKLASMWLIQRHVDAMARFVFVADGIPFTNGIPFDTPEAEYRRYANLSCFESILKANSLTNAALRRMGDLMHDIEVNYWGEKRFTESEPLNREIREIIRTNGPSRDRCVTQSFAAFDRVFQGRAQAPEPTEPATR